MHLLRHVTRTPYSYVYARIENDDARHTDWGDYFFLTLASSALMMAREESRSFFQAAIVSAEGFSEGGKDDK